ncbi:MAG TPA: hypothetical protein VGE11_03710 [Pseudonocardia sp.]
MSGPVVGTAVVSVIAKTVGPVFTAVIGPVSAALIGSANDTVSTAVSGTVGGSTPPPVCLAAAMLSAAACLAPQGVGRDRWRDLTAAAPPSGPPVPALRLVWLVVGCCAIGAVGWVVGGAVTSAVAVGLGALAGAGARQVLSRQLVERTENGAELAGCWELLAACLEAGLPVASAVLATATPLDGAAGEGLRRVAGLLELGADPVDAWRTVEHRPALAPFARAAARSAGTGAALASVAHTECVRLRGAHRLRSGPCATGRRDDHRSARPLFPAGVPRTRHRAGRDRPRERGAGAMVTAVAPHQEKEFTCLPPVPAPLVCSPGFATTPG